MLEPAFNLILSLHKRPVTLSRPGGVTVNINMSPSNYKRNLEVVNEVTTKGREYVVSKKTLDGVSFGVPKRGDIVSDGAVYEGVIYEVMELQNFGGAIMGYRIRLQ
jgi:hypothetical protein